MPERSEIHVCPPEYQDYLRYLGGVNRYDQNNFKLGWAQYETFIAGGVWSVDEKYFKGYRPLLAGSGEPCWTLFQWHDASEYGSPEYYYLTNYDPDTGLQTLGEYCYSGRYEVLYNLRYHEIVNGKIEFYSPPLSFKILDLIVPVVVAAKDITAAKRKTAWEEMRAREEAEKVGAIERKLMDNAVPFTQGVSFTRQGIRSTAIDQKMLALQRELPKIAKNVAQFRKGFQTR